MSEQEAGRRRVGVFFAVVIVGWVVFAVAWLATR